jgi:predicted N-formylglutamate amidohydrolase
MRGVQRRAIVTCEHATNRIPEGLGDLGLDPAVLDSHVAWDPGAATVATELAQRFGWPLQLGTVTRLVTDLNRSPHTPEAVPVRAFGVEVPGNARLDAEGRATRIERYHRPYWEAAGSAVDRALAAGGTLLHVSVHSFTPVYEGRVRDVDLGVLLDPDHPLEGPLGRRLMEGLARSGLRVRLNEPWDGRGDGLTTALRGSRPTDRYLSVELELSHALLGQLERVARLFGDVLATVPEHPGPG